MCDRLSLRFVFLFASLRVAMEVYMRNVCKLKHQQFIPFSFSHKVLQNRAFQIVAPGTEGALKAWVSRGPVNITVVASSVPVSAALPNALSLSIPEGTSGPVGFGNTGYWGGLLPEVYSYMSNSLIY